MVERNSQQVGCQGLAFDFTSAAPRWFTLDSGVTQERPIPADLAAGDRPRAAGKGGARGVQV